MTPIKPDASNITVPVLVQGQEAVMLVDTGASRSCLSSTFYNQHQHKLGPLRYTSPVQGADGTRLAVAGQTRQLPLEWEHNIFETSLIVLKGLSGIDGILGMDVLKPLKVKISAHEHSATPSGDNDVSPTLLYLSENIDVPPNCWRQILLRHDTPGAISVFSPSPKLPPGLRAAPTVSSGESAVVVVANYSSEPVRLQKGWEIGTVDPGELTNPPQSNPGGIIMPEIPDGLTPAQTCDLRNLLMDYGDIFAQGEDDNGSTSLAEHRIYTQGPPIKQQFRRQPPARREEERNQVEAMSQRGIIRPSTSPWSSPVVLAKKKDGSLRFCVDYRRLNAVTVKDAQPLPRIDDTLEALHGSRWFSTLDLQCGYWQIPIREKDKKKTAFCTGDGQLWEFEVLPFGVCNGPASFARLMDAVLAGLTWKTCLAYLDDIIVYAPTWGVHLQRLQEVFERIRGAGLKLKPSKCCLAREEVPFLGHVVNSRGIQPDPKKLEAISAIPAPANVRELRSFLGIASYYRRFIRGFADIAAPLHCLLDKGATWKWSTECDEAFRGLKAHLTQSPVAAYPDFSLPFTLYTDASNLGLGAVLSQKQDGKERMIACASRTLSPSEKNYSTTKKECLGVVWGIRYFRPYLLSNHFEVITDHYSLKWLKSMSTESALLHRWSSELEEYNFTIKHRPGKLQGHADGLSRLPIHQPEVECIASLITEDNEEDDQLREAVAGTAWPPWLAEKWRGKLRVCNGRVMNHEGQVMLGPKAARKFLSSLHSAQGGHPGFKKTLALFRSRYYTDGAPTLARDVTSQCLGCQIGTDYKLKTEVKGHITASRPWELVAVDVMGPLRMYDGKQYIVTFIDCFTRYVIAIPTSNHTVTTVAQLLLQHVISAFGVPEAILSDRGPEFTSRLWNHLGEIFGYKLVHTSPYYAQGNSICERVHRTINNAIRASLACNSSGDWPRVLPVIQLTLNAATSDATGYPPYWLLFGRSPRMPAEVPNLPESLHDVPLSTSQHLKELQRTLRVAHEAVKERSPATNQDITHPFSIGDAVLVRVPPPHRHHKLAPNWHGPFTITSLPSPFQITYNTELGSRTVHISHAKLFHAPADPLHGESQEKHSDAGQDGNQRRYITPAFTRRRLNVDAVEPQVGEQRNEADPVHPPLQARPVRQRRAPQRLGDWLSEAEMSDLDNLANDVQQPRPAETEDAPPPAEAVRLLSPRKEDARMDYPTASNIKFAWASWGDAVVSARRRHKFVASVRDAIAKGERPRLHVRTSDSHPNFTLGRQVASLAEGCDWVFVPSEWRWTTQCSRGRLLSVGGSSVTPKTEPPSERRREPPPEHSESDYIRATRNAGSSVPTSPWPRENLPASPQPFGVAQCPRDPSSTGVAHCPRKIPLHSSSTGVAHCPRRTPLHSSSTGVAQCPQKTPVPPPSPIVTSCPSPLPRPAPPQSHPPVPEPSSPPVLRKLPLTPRLQYARGRLRALYAAPSPISPLTPSPGQGGLLTPSPGRGRSSHETRGREAWTPSPVPSPVGRPATPGRFLTDAAEPEAALLGVYRLPSTTTL